MQKLRSSAPAYGTVPLSTPNPIAPRPPAVVPTPSTDVPEPLPPEVIDPLLPGEHRPIREPGAPPPPKHS